MSEKINLTILVAPLDWGLGHATRCIPLITELLDLGCKVIIAAEGAQEKLLKTEFPHLYFVHLEGYRIEYSNSKRFFTLKIITQLPRIARAIRNERGWLNNFISSNRIDAVISDNRYGLYHPGVPAVFMTHQLLIKGPLKIVERLLQKINYRLIANFQRCWIPDQEEELNIAGDLSHPATLPDIPVEYLGGLSRLDGTAPPKREFDLLVVISGPEPQRTCLERKVLKELQAFPGKVLLVRGLPGQQKTPAAGEHITIKNHLPAKEMTECFLKSEWIISRSGYTTVMDILKLQKKAVLVPTPGQTEQEYLAKHLEKQGWSIRIAQDDFPLALLLEKMESFEYKVPQLKMEIYRTVVRQFVKSLEAGTNT